MQENQKKAFDFAAETTKQLITLSTAIITITITFSKDLVSSIAQDSLWCIFLSWALFIISIFFGIFTLMALTGTLQPLSSEKKNKEDSNTGLKKEDNYEKQDFSINGRNVRIPSILQISTFIIGIIFTVIFGYKSFSHSSSTTNKAGSKQIELSKKTESYVEPSERIDIINLNNYKTGSTQHRLISNAG